VPFRLLGVAAQLDEDDAWGQLLRSYAESGHQVTLACVPSAKELDSVSTSRRLRIHGVTLLEMPGQQGPADLEAAVLRIISTIRPHVVVAASNDAPIWPPLASAVSKARGAGTGSAALPAKLYYRLSKGTPGVAVTTVVRIPGATSPELLVRALPEPWITGVLERDLFSGLLAELDDARRLAAAS
jgi:hypothetical protein